MRKPSRSVELDDIISSQIIGDDPEVIALVMKTHLALEAVLIEIIRTFRDDDKIYRLTFPAKIDLLEKEGKIALFEKEAFIRVNEFRNDFAHIFGHRVTLSHAMQLARDLESDGIDFSDSVGHYTEEQAEEYYGGLLGVLAEIGWCVLFHASYILSERGGRDIFSANPSSPQLTTP